MKRVMFAEVLVLLIFIIIFLTVFSQASLNVEVKEKNNIVISDIRNPAVYEFTITNNGQTANYEIYSLAGVSFSQRGAFEIKTGSSTLEIKAFPKKDILKQTGIYSFQYHLRGPEGEIFTDNLRMKIVPLEEAFFIKTIKFLPSDKETVISIRNRNNALIEDVKVYFVSAFFNERKILMFNPYEEINLSVPLDANKLRKARAGSYILTSKISIEDAAKELESVILYLEEENVSVTESNTGSIIRKTTITKRNEGNVQATVDIEMNKNIITRLVSVYTIEPLTVQRKGFSVLYSWEKEIEPGESFTVSSVTNYTLPLILLILVVIIAFLVRYYAKTDLIIQKRVSFVKTRNGLFALKVQIRLKAKKAVEQIKVVDRIPMATQIYKEHMSRPDEIDHSSRRIVWNIDRLAAGEERIYSYIIYSKVKIIGRFELPATSVSFKYMGALNHVVSNKTFFVAETSQLS